MNITQKKCHILAAMQTAVLVCALVLSTVLFSLGLRTLVHSQQERELKDAADFIQDALINNESKQIQAGFPDLPYYLQFAAFYDSSERIISTNDPFLPLFESTEGKSVRYFEKDFFTDGDLNILYYAQSLIIDEEPVVVETAMNLDTDFSDDMRKKLPQVALFTLLPVALLAYLAFFFIAKEVYGQNSQASTL